MEDTSKKGKAGKAREAVSQEKGMSEQTIAITDRLKAEGRLTRNGKNSLRTVSIELSKFTEAFSSISDTIQSQSASLSDMAGAAQSQAEADKTKSDFDELKDGENGGVAAEIAKLRQQTDLLNAKKDLKGAKGPGIMGMIGNLFGGSALGMLGKLALLAGGGMIAYNLAKGFIDKATGGKWSDFEDAVGGIEWSEVGNDLKEFTTSARDFAKQASTGMGEMIEFFDDPLKLLLGLSGAVIGAKLITSIGTSIAAKAITGLVMGSPGAMSGAGGKGMGKAMMGALGVAGLIYAEDIASFIVGDARNADVASFDIKNAAATVGITAASGASIGSMFGKKGMLIGAVAGAAYGLGLGVVDLIKENFLDMGKTSKAGRNVVEKLRQRKKMLDSLGEERFAAWSAGQEDYNEILLKAEAKAAREELKAKVAAAEEAVSNVRTMQISGTDDITGEKTYSPRAARLVSADMERANERLELARSQLATLDTALVGEGIQISPDKTPEQLAQIAAREAADAKELSDAMNRGNGNQGTWIEPGSPAEAAYLRANSPAAGPDLNKKIVAPGDGIMLQNVPGANISATSVGPTINNVFNQNDFMQASMNTLGANQLSPFAGSGPLKAGS